MGPSQVSVEILKLFCDKGLTEIIKLFALSTNRIIRTGWLKSHLSISQRGTEQSNVLTIEQSV